MHTLDELDRRILRVLSRDAHTHFRDIAKECETTVGTVHNRIKKMTDVGVIRRFIPEVDARKLGYDICALIDIEIKGGHLEEVQRELAKDPHVTCIYDITGEYDTTLVAKFKDTADLNAFVKGVLANRNVKRTQTKLVLNVVKEAFAPEA